MSPEDRQRRIVAALEDFQRRKTLGRAPDPATYRDGLGDEYDEFVRLVEAADAIDRAKAPPPSEPSLPRAFGPYVLERVLGGGGMGVVYEALHRDLVRRVAVKVLPRTLDADPAMVERFRREARACAQVRHPNVVTVYEAGDVDGQLYYAMELVEGRTLQAHIDEGSVPPTRALFAALAEVADALDTLHTVGVVHRDVKPANLIVRPDGRIVLADFGLARTLYGGNLTQTGEALGTPPYMSPEQLLGRVRDVDARTDVYGLGATLYHALVGSPPFAAKEQQDLVRLILVQRPDPIAKRRPHGAAPLEPGVEDVVLKALEKRKEDRYVTAGELRDDLRAVAAGAAPTGRPVPPWKRALRGARPYALPVAAAVALLVGGYAWWMAQPGRVRIGFVLPASFYVDDVLSGHVTEKADLVAFLAPGEHRVRLAGTGFRTEDEVIYVKPRDSKSYMPSPLGIRDVDPNNPAVMSELARALRLDWRRWAEFENTRSSAENVVPFLPRGNVRIQDLDVVEFAVRSDWSSDAPLVVFFARAGKDLVPPVPFPPDEALERKGDDGNTVTFAVPAAVREALRVGDVLHWGVRPARDLGAGPIRDGTARAQVVADEATAAVAALDALLASQPATLAAVFRSRLLREKGLPTAAARVVLANVPRAAREFYGWLALHDALRGAGVPVDLPVVLAAHEAVRARAATDAFRAHPGLVPDLAPPAPR